MTKHFIRYRKSGNDSPIKSGNGNYQAWAKYREDRPSWKPPVQIGDFVWILSGTDVGKKKLYKLEYYFKAASNWERSDEIICINGVEGAFLDYKPNIGEEPWFKDFFQQIGNGGTGFQKVPEKNISYFIKLMEESALRGDLLKVAEAEQAILEHVPDADLISLPDSLNNKGNHRPISPDDDEKKRKKQAENGLEGEELARLFEIERLRDLKCPDPAAYIDHVAKKDVGLGYDILTTWEETRYIEVKTSASGSDSFFISSNEVGVLTNYNNLAWIYLVDLTKKDDIRNCIRTINNPGYKFNKEIKLVPIQYCASLMNLS